MLKHLSNTSSPHIDHMANATLQSCDPNVQTLMPGVTAIVSPSKQASKQTSKRMIWLSWQGHCLCLLCCLAYKTIICWLQHDCDVPNIVNQGSITHLWHVLYCASVLINVQRCTSICMLVGGWWKEDKKEHFKTLVRIGLGHEKLPRSSYQHLPMM